MIAQVQVVVDELGAASLDDLERGGLISRRTQERLDEVDSRAAEAGCSDEEIDFLLAERADRIRGDGVVAEAVREALGQYEGLPFSTEG